jgi:hypothetical protein
MVTLDGMGQPQVVQGLHRRERVADLLGGGQRPAGDRFGGVESGSLPFDLRKQGQQPSLPHAGQAGRCQGLPYDANRVIVAACAPLSVRKHPGCLTPARGVGHDH